MAYGALLGQRPGDIGALVVNYIGNWGYSSLRALNLCACTIFQSLHAVVSVLPVDKVTVTSPPSPTQSTSLN
jgi:hypothetical protein